MKKGKSICIFSSKGGSGKTTTALNLAGLFSSLNKKVLLIDLDLFNGGIATYLNIAVDKTIYNVVEDIANKRFNSINDYVSQYNENIDVISTLKDPRQGSRIIPNYIEILINKAIYEYDYLIIDLDHSLSEFNVSVLDYVDHILLTLVNDLMAIKNTRNLIKIFTDAEKSNYKIVLNNFINPNKNYYSLYDIKSMIRANVDYKIDSSFYLKTIDSYASDGKILSLEKKFVKTCPKVYKSYYAICQDIMENHDEK